MTYRHTLRSSIRKKRRELPLLIQQKAAHAVANFICHTDWFQNAFHIAYYAAIQGEIDPYLLMREAWKMGKICYLPALLSSKEQLCFSPYFAEDSLTVNKYGIWEPLVDALPSSRLDMLDIVFTPLVAFDAHGNRLGSGKGYYDKTFAHIPNVIRERKIKIVGLGYDFQHVPELIAKSWDIPLNKIVVFDTVNDSVYDYDYV